jgi:glycosyltransferase involved in cell wall biosynthesis
MSTRVPDAGTRGQLSFCTIISKNYLAMARTLAESLRATNPCCRLFVLLVDHVDGYFDPGTEPFTVVEIEDLPIPDLPRFCFQYTILELNTAAKAYFMEYLFDVHGAGKLVYLDPDIQVLRHLDQLAAILDHDDIVLTPHVTQPIPVDGKKHSEPDLLLCGTYNLGFIALADTPRVRTFLRWWQERLYTGCRYAKEEGLFVDQHWIDLVPAYFDGVHVLRHPGYNIAYWNLHYRKVTLHGDEVLVNGLPAFFFHYSGYNHRQPDVISKWQDRVTMDQIGDAQQLFQGYTRRLLANGFEGSRGWPYAYGTFDNGVAIPDVARRDYLLQGEQARRFGNPFVTEGASSYWSWLCQPEDCRLPPLLRLVAQGRADLRLAFSDFNGVHRDAFLDWIEHQRDQLHQQWRIEQPLLERALGRQEAPASALKPLLVRSRGPGAGLPFGVNLTGYFASEKGVGEAARAVIRALEAVAIPYVLNNICDEGSHNRDHTYGAFRQDNPYAVNLVQVNADVATPYLRWKADMLRGRVNIGYWNWELSVFPAEWQSSFSFFHEVWAPSLFTQRSIASVSPIPVRLVPFSIAVPPRPVPGMGRAYFGLPRGPLLFFFAFDSHSYMERKNPLGLIEAFRRAFGDSRDVLLVIKTMHTSDSDDYSRLVETCSRYGNVRLLDRVFSRTEMHALMMCCDAYVSLHRSEGFGLTIAEAMAMGKPVIATAYSSNVDFMTADNSCPVRFRLAKLEKDHGPYRTGAEWAGPLVEHAAAEMRRIAFTPSLGRSLGATARKDVGLYLNPARVGELIYSRLTALLGSNSAVADSAEGVRRLAA